MLAVIEKNYIKFQTFLNTLSPLGPKGTATICSRPNRWQFVCVAFAPLVACSLFLCFSSLPALLRHRRPNNIIKHLLYVSISIFSNRPGAEGEWRLRKDGSQLALAIIKANLFKSPTTCHNICLGPEKRLY